MDEKHFTFFDAASPTYMLVNSEVAEGDLGEAFPSFARNLAALLFAGACVGAIGFLWSSRNVPLPSRRNCGSLESSCMRWKGSRLRKPSATKSTA